MILIWHSQLAWEEYSLWAMAVTLWVRPHGLCEQIFVLENRQHGEGPVVEPRSSIRSFAEFPPNLAHILLSGNCEIFPV